MSQGQEACARRRWYGRCCGVVSVVVVLEEAHVLVLLAQSRGSGPWRGREPQAEMPQPLHKPQDDDKGLVAVLAASSYGLGTHRTCLFAWEGAL